MNKKMVLTIGFALATLIGFGLYKSSKLKSIHIIKSVTINGTTEEVFDMVKYLNNFPKWSPFLAQDPSQKYEIKGIDGTIGVQYHWEGNKGKDLGYQELVKMEPNHFISLKCDIQKPFKAQPIFEYRFKRTKNGVTVIQDFKLESGIMDAFFMWLFGAKKEMENTNEHGMNLLKKAVEKNNNN